MIIVCLRSKLIVATHIFAVRGRVVLGHDIHFERLPCDDDVVSLVKDVSSKNRL